MLPITRMSPENIVVSLLKEKPVTKGHVLCDSVYAKVHNSQIHRSRKQWLPGVVGVEGGKLEEGVLTSTRVLGDGG